MPNRFSRRSFLVRSLQGAAGGLLLSGGGAMLEACAPSGGGGTTSTSPKKGGSLTFGTESEINSFDPRQGAWDSTGHQYARTIFDPLFTQASDGSVVPYLAESISHDTTYTQWTIKLRQGVNFHDGSPLDATAVKANLDGTAASPLTGPSLFNLAKTTVVDPLTVMITCRSPWVPFPLYLTGQLGYMAGLKQLADTSGKANPIGTGPFVFKEWVPGDHMTATRNPNYWRQGLPYLDSITYKPIPDPQSRGNSLRAGNIDVIHSSDTQTTADFQHDTKFNQVNDLNSSLGEPDQIFFMLNTAVPPMDDIRVRQALAYSLDKQKLINTLFNGIPSPASGPFPKTSPYAGPTGYPDMDLTKARDLVAAYQKDKGPISFKFGTVNNPKNLAINQFVQANWKAVGINTEIATFEQASYIQAALVGSYQAIIWRQFNAADPDSNYVWWSSATASPLGKPALNFARNKDPEIDAALQAGRTQADPAVRVQAYQKVAAKLGTDIPYIWVAPAVWIVAARAVVGGLAQSTVPDGSKARGMSAGVIWPANLWRSS